MDGEVITSSSDGTGSEEREFEVIRGLVGDILSDVRNGDLDLTLEDLLVLATAGDGWPR